MDHIYAILKTVNLALRWWCGLLLLLLSAGSLTKASGDMSESSLFSLHCHFHGQGVAFESMPVPLLNGRWLFIHVVFVEGEKVVSRS